MAMRLRDPIDQQARFLALADRLDRATAKVHACTVWMAADRDRDVAWLTDDQHAILAGRAEELIATLPAALIPMPRSSS